MKKQKILELIQLMEERGLAELEIGSLFGKIRISRVMDRVSAVVSTSSGPAAGELRQEEEPVLSNAVAEIAGLDEVTAPLVGTFYSAPSPGAP